MSAQNLAQGLDAGKMVTEVLVSPQPRGEVVTEAISARAAQQIEAERPVPPVPPVPERGTALGRYTVLETLGAGGMGVVVAAYDSELDRKIALKLLRPGKLGFDSADVAHSRLVREAKAMAQLSHPNVITVHDVGTLDDRVFVSMEFVDGNTIGDWLRITPRKWRDIVAMFVQAARGLAAAHRIGLVHRDFKPDNVLVGKDGRVRVTDFGLARAAGMSDSLGQGLPIASGPSTPTSLAEDVTQPGVVMGTPAYMAPEQVQGLPLDDRTDQFSFCIALFEALYGERPFAGDGHKELLGNMVRGKVKDVSVSVSVPKRIHRAVLRGLRSNPDERWSSMESLLHALAPKRGRASRRWFAISGVAVGIGVGVWGAGQILQASEVCDHAEDRLAGVWDGERKDAARDALLATGLAYAPDTWSRVEGWLDEYTASWVTAHRETCEATHLRGEQSAELLDARMTCLDQRLREADALVEVLARADGVVVERATGAAASLPAIDRCREVQALSEVLMPRDPEAARAIDRLRVQLADARALDRLGHHSDGLAVAEAAIEAVGDVEDVASQAEAMEVLGSLQQHLGDAVAAEDSLSEAALLAAANEHDDVAAGAAIKMIGLVGGRDGGYKKGLLWGWYAESAVKRLGSGGLAEAEMLEGLGQVLALHGKHEEARAHLERAIGIREQASDSEHPALATTLTHLGRILGERGQLAEAQSRYQRALEIRERALGAQHPEVAESLRALGDLLSRQGKHDEAGVLYERARSLAASDLIG